MLTGQKTRREENKTKMGMERKTDKVKQATRETQSIFFLIKLEEMATSFRSLQTVLVKGLLSPSHNKKGHRLCNFY